MSVYLSVLLSLAHTRTHRHTFRALIISSKVAWCLNAAVLAIVSCGAFSAVVIDSIEKAVGASLAFGSLLSLAGDEFLARTAGW